jgi:hypothetical protein
MKVWRSETLTMLTANVSCYIKKNRTWIKLLWRIMIFMIH